MFFICIITHVTVDINECEGYSGCHQVCNNTEGSYYCSCNTGFVLVVDNRTCEGNYVYMYVVQQYLMIEIDNSKKHAQKQPDL